MTTRREGCRRKCDTLPPRTSRCSEYTVAWGNLRVALVCCLPGKEVIGVPPAATDIRANDPAPDDQAQELRELVIGRAVDPHWRKRLYDQVRAAGFLSRSAAGDALFYARTCAPAGQEPERAT